MKSIFKKIAFVLALAMVVTMMPTKAAAAAESDGPQMYSTLKLCYREESWFRSSYRNLHR